MNSESRRGSRGSRFGWWPVVILLLAYSLTRWYNLTLLPIHYDELVHLDRVGRIVAEHDFWIGLREDLKGAHLWPIALVWPLSANHMWIGRFVSTLAGVWAGLGIYKTGSLVFSSRQTGLIAAALYLISPGALFYDRIALADGLLTAYGVWVLYGVAAYFMAGDNRPLGWAGLVLVLAALTKPNGFLFFAIPVLGFFLLRQGPFKPRQFLLGLLPLIVAGAVAVALIVPYLPDTRQIFLEKASMNGMGWAGLWTRFSQNMVYSQGWLVSLLSWPITIFAAAGLALAMFSRQARRPAVWLALAALGQWLFFAFVSQLWYPRYLLPMVPALVLLAAYGLNAAINRPASGGVKAALAVAVVALLWPALSTDFWLLVDPPRAALHPDQSRQYITGWPSAYGLPEVADFIRQVANEHPEIYVVYNERVMARKGLPYYLTDPPPNIEFVEVDPFEGDAIETVNELAKDRPTFFILNTAREKGMDDFIKNPAAFPQARHVFSVSRPGGLTHWDVYQWEPVPD